jgi:hypothetical protein
MNLLKELRGLERRRGPSGKDSLDHRSNQHDDLANSAAGALVAVWSLKMQAALIPILGV